MASENSDEFSGRRTRSGRKAAAPLHSMPVQPSRPSRRSRKHTEEQLIEDEDQDVIEVPVTPPSKKAMLREVEKAVVAKNSETDNDGDTDVEIIENDQPQIVEEVVTNDDCFVYEEQVEEDKHHHAPSDDVEMYTVPGNVDEKSSSFPFGVVGHSETSEEAQNEYEEVVEEVNESESAVESSLLASLVGDNANSLPSVGGGEETFSKKEEFDAKLSNSSVEPPIQPNCEKMDSDDDSLSENAIAEEIATNGADTSDATNVNTEIISEDELPLPTKPEINDAEEVSDEELPAPQRAELPADAEVISEDELPASAADSKLSSAKKQKRKAVAKEDDEEEPRRTSASPPKEKNNESKSRADEQYNPMSPTGESNDEAPPPEKKTKLETVKDSSIEKEKEKDKKKDKDKEKEKEREREREHKERKKLPDLDKYWRTVKEDPADFTGWTYLLQYVDNESDAEAAREAYDAFLAHYPYCYGYWRKYADYEKRKGIKANCNAVFERGLEAIPLSVDLWIHYLSHVKSCNPDNEEYIRSQFERAIDSCGLEFRSDKLWDAFIKWENDAKRYQNVVKIYDRLLTIPTQGYNAHFDNFQDLINQHSIRSTITDEELKRIRAELRSSARSSSSRSKSSSHRGSSKEKDNKDKDKEHRDHKDKDHKDKDHKDKDHKDKDHKDKDHKDKDHKDKDHKDKDHKDKDHKDKDHKDKDHKDEKKDDIETANETQLATEENHESDGEKQSRDSSLSDLSTLTEEEINSIKDKVISIRRKMHKTTVAAVTARWAFEEGIKRPYFHVKPLERCQLKNWKDYLDFEIERCDRKRIIVLFERCLIACALYDEFWLKMIRYLETQSNLPDHVDITRDVFRRACQIHHPDKPSLHLMWAAFEECQNNFDGAADVLSTIENRCPNLLQIAYRRINVERRRGNLEKSRELYEHYISTAKNKTIAGSLAIKYARFLNKICNDLDGGLRILQQALEKDPANTRVALQMIDLVLQRSQVNEDEVVAIMDKFMARESIDPEQKVLFAQRKVEFLEDFGSTAKGLQDAQRTLQLALSKANEVKKKRENSPTRKSASSAKDSSGGGISTTGNQQTSAYNNGAAVAPTAAGYNYSYYNQQSSSGAAYPQQQSYDNYYNQWQYGSNYNSYGGQWSGYGNYY